MAVANARKDMNSDVAALYIESLNAVEGIMHRESRFGIQARIPNEIWLVLYCITALGMMAVGYQTESRDRNGPWCGRSWPFPSPWCLR